MILEQLLNVSEVIKARISQALGFKSGWITHNTAGRQGFTIHHGHHTADAGAAADLRPAEGLHQWHRQSQSAGFHHDAVELISPLQQGLHRRQEFVLHGATEAAVGQLHHAAVQLLLRAEAAAADQVAIDADLTKFIHQHRQPQPAVEQKLAQQGGFARTEKAGHHCDRQTSQIAAHLKAPGWSRRRRRPPPSAIQPEAAAELAGPDWPRSAPR